MTISNNNFSNIGRIGVYNGFGTNSIITGNTYTGKGTGNWLDYAFEVGRNSRATITNNTISNNKGVAIVDGSTSAGILVTSYFNPETPSQAAITGNNISNSTFGVAVGYADVDSSIISQFASNTFNSNGYDLDNHTINNIDARNNIWSVTDQSNLDQIEAKINHYCSGSTYVHGVCSGTDDYGAGFGMVQYKNIGTPTNLGWNVHSKSATPNETPVDLDCSAGTVYTNENSVAHNWSAVNGSNIKYQREVTYPSGSIEYFKAGSNTYTPFSTFGGTSGIEGLWKTRVRAYVDANGNNLPDTGEETSSWSNECKITYDKTTPSIPVLTWPINGEVINDNTPLMQWDDSTDTGGSGIAGYYYRVYYNCSDVNDSSTCSSVYPNSTGKWLISSQYQAGHTNDGTYYWQVRAQDKAGNQSSWSDLEKVSIDTIAPTSSIFFQGDLDETKNITTNNRWFESFDNLNLKIDVGDQSTDKINYQILNGDVTCPAQSSEDYTAVAHNTNLAPIVNPKPDGVYSLCYFASDLAGNKESTIHKELLKKDNTNPSFTIDSVSGNLVDGVYYNKTDITTQITVNDADSGYSHARYDLYSADSNHTCTTFIGWNQDTASSVTNPVSRTLTKSGLADGNYCLRVWTYDNVQNKAWTDSSGYNGWIKFTIDSTPPLVDAGTDKIKNTSFNQDATVSGASTYQWSKESGPGVITFGSPNAEDTTISANTDGTYVLRLTATDETNNTSYDEMSLVWDTQAPTISDKTTFSGWYNTNQTSTFTYSDTNGIASGTPVSCDITTEGTNQVCSVTPNVCDVAGNCNTTTVTSNGANIDKTPPSSIISTPVNNGTNSVVYSNSWNGNITGTATDALSGVNNVKVSIQNGSGQYFNGTTFVTSGTEILLDTTYSSGNWSYNGLTSPTEGSYTIRSHAVDNAGNIENTYTLTIILDKTIPEVAISLNPANPDAQNGWYKTQPEVTLTATDANIDKIEYQWNSQTGNWTTYTVPFKPVSENAHILYYRAQDKAGNYSDVGVKNIKWDQTDLTNGPLNINVSPNPTSGTTSVVKWEEAKDNTGIDRYEVKWSLKNGDKSHTDSVGSDIREHTINNLTEGIWTVEVKAFDGSGNSKSASTNLTVDRTGPSAPTLSILGTGTGSVSLGWSKVDDANNYFILYGTSPGSYQYSANVGNVQNYTVQGLGTGSYYFIVKAVDSSGNQSENSNEVSTGAIVGAPGVAENTPAAGFAENVLGKATESAKLTPTATTTGTVLGINKKNGKKNLLWWPWILLLIIPFGLFGYKKWKK